MPSHQLKCSWEELQQTFPFIPFGTAALIQCSDDHDHTFDPQEGDSCWARLDPTEKVWNKGLAIRKVTGVPDSYVVEVDGCR